MIIKSLRIKIQLAKLISRFPYLPVSAVLLLDLFLVSFVFGIVGYLLSVSGGLSLDEGRLYIAFLMFLCPLVYGMYLNKTYLAFVRYTDIFEVFKLFKTFVLASFFFVFLHLLLNSIGKSLMEGGVWIWFTIASPMAFTLLILYRLIVREVFARLHLNIRPVRKVLIFGAGLSGSMLGKLLLENRNFKYEVKGFVDDDPAKDGKHLHGIKIYKGDSKLQELFQAHEVNELIISAPSLNNRRKKEIFDIAYQYKVKVSLVPKFEDWRNSQLDIKELRRVSLEELLGRDPIVLNQKHLTDNFSAKIILVTGAGGSIGSELCRQLVKYDIQKIILLDMAESALYDIQQELLRVFPSDRIEAVLADVREREEIFQIFGKYQPDLVFHAAAYKHVPLMEAFPKLAIRTNVLGTKNLADASVKYGVKKFVMVSTDKAVNPTNVMGASKRTAEVYVQSLFFDRLKKGCNTPQFITTRFGNVLGSNGSVIPLFLKQIEAGGPVTVTHKDIERYFMTIPEACNLVTEAASMGKGGEIYVFDMGIPVKIYDLAEKMIVLSGKIPHQDVVIKVTGLRKGEKLYEELIGNGENLLPTHHEKIQIVESKLFDHEEIRQEINNVQVELNGGMDNYYLVGCLKRLLPEFKSSFSEFQILDCAEEKKKSNIGSIYS